MDLVDEINQRKSSGLYRVRKIVDFSKGSIATIENEQYINAGIIQKQGGDEGQGYWLTYEQVRHQPNFIRITSNVHLLQLSSALL